MTGTLRATIRRSPGAALLAASLAACSPTPQAEPPGPRLGPEIGTGDHGTGSVTLSVVVDRAAGLRTPRDLAFNPLRPEELWIVNRGDDSVVIVHDTLSEGRRSERRKDGYALHFMARPSSIAFGGSETTLGLPGTFATCQETRNTYDDMAPANDFMGPTLWSSDLTIFAKRNPNGLGSHLDMLHESPNCMGIAWQEDNVYWAFGGLLRDIVRYDFGADDGIGNDDHSDGRVTHYVTGQVTMAAGVPSHMVYSAADGMLYVADSGAGRIVKLDTASGHPGARVRAKEIIELNQLVEDAVLSEVVPEGDLLKVPSGLELRGELLFVSDNETGRVSAFTLDGQRVNYLDTGLPAGALMGMAFGPDGKLYLVDAEGERVLRIDVPAPPG